MAEHTMSTIEQKITAALVDATLASTAIAALIEETQTALTEAEANIETERKKALDPLQSPDPVKAREAIGTAEFSRDRLRSLRPRLLQDFKKAEARERYERLKPRYEAVQAKRNALGEKLQDLYVSFLEAIVPLLREVEGVNAELRRLNWDVLQASVYDELPLLELFPEQFLGDLRLPAWKADGPSWPPHRSLDVSSIMPAPRHDPHYSADWWACREADKRRAQWEADRAQLIHLATVVAQAKAQDPTASWLSGEEAKLAQLRERVSKGPEGECAGH
jgi:hypothetical protein